MLPKPNVMPLSLKDSLDSFWFTRRLYGKTDEVSLRPSSQLFDLLMFWMHSLPLANLHSLQP